MDNKVVAIIGSGFSGITLVHHLLENARTGSLQITVFSDPELFLTGYAYKPYSKRHLLNVSAGKMSAFQTNPQDYLDFIMETESYKDLDRALVANAFTPRYLYGEYLVGIWEKCLRVASSKNIKVEVICEKVILLEKIDLSYQIITENSKYTSSHCVLATGNALPAVPSVRNARLLRYPFFANNPWDAASVDQLDPELPVLILGNGLTMVDAIIGLMEKGFKGQIITVSPNGFHILPHRHGGINYTDLAMELKEEMRLSELVSLANKHVKKVRRLGLSAEPVIDALRPHVSYYWRNFSLKEKSVFLSRLRHLWGVARHRIPIHLHDKLVRLQLEGRLRMCKGKLYAVDEVEANMLQVELVGENEQINTIRVQRIINCTGPQMNYSKAEGLLGNCVRNGLLTQDPLFLGVSTNLKNYQTLDLNGKQNEKLYAVGSLLRGELWETTSVPDIRQQTEQLAKIILAS